LIGTLVLIVWLGVASRYVFGWGITWTEELARYLMIWAALLAVGIGVYNREHIGFEMLLVRLPRKFQYALRLCLDILGILFFAFLAVKGNEMTALGGQQYATIFNITMQIPFASVPVAAGIAAFQSTVVMLRDMPTYGKRNLPPAMPTGELPQ